MAAFVPAGYPHVIENMGRRALRFPAGVRAAGAERCTATDRPRVAGRILEVIRDSTTGQLPPEGNGHVVAVTASEGGCARFAGKGTAKLLLDAKATGSDSRDRQLLEFPSTRGAATTITVESTETPVTWWQGEGN